MEEVSICENAFSHIEPTIMVLRFFGMAPVSCKYERSHFILKISTKHIWLNYAMAFILGLYAVYGLWSDSNEYRRGGPSFRVHKEIDVYVNTFDIGIIILSVVSTMIGSPFRVRYLMDALHCLNKMDVIVSKPKSSTKRDRKLSILIMIIAFVVSQTGLILDGEFHIREAKIGSWFLYLRTYSTIFIFYSAILAQQFSYWSLVRSIRNHVTAMNNKLTEVVRNEDGHKDIMILDFTKKMQKENKSGNMPTVREHNGYHKIKIKDSALDVIQCLMVLHEQIYICIHSINRFFDFPVLFILINCLIELVINPWALLTRRDFARGEVWIFFMWIVIHVIQLILLIEPINGVLSEVELFSIQYQLCSLKFTSVDMIILRRSVYTIVTSTVTTYLVILIQINK